MAQYVLNNPNVRKQWEGERAKGYTFATSVADLIDNSIGEGQASRVHMDFKIQPGSGALRFYLADNGIGMNSEKLFNAMTQGSEASTQKHELSKFGYGMKTASWAHARRLVVVSRPKGDEDNPCAAAWDGDHIIKVGAWEMEVISDVPNVYLEYLDKLDGKVSGTLIVWENIDRLLHGYKDLEGVHRNKGLKRLLQEVHEHLGLVFHRYLDPRFTEAPNIEILINDEPVGPWDPFVEQAANYLQPSQQVKLEEPGKRPILVSPFVLPREDNWNPEKHGNYRQVVKRDSELQGFYLYRANRLLQMPSWLGLGKQEPHANLARVKIDINPDWDEVLHVDVKKASVAFPQKLKDELQKVRAAVVNLADQQRRQNQPPKPAPGNTHNVSSAAIDNQKSVIKRAEVSNVDPESQSATVKNSSGEVPGIRLVQPKSGLPVNIVISETPLSDGQLWEPVVTQGDTGDVDTALHLAETHEFYQRIYVPASLNQNGKTAVDMIFWALAQAELNQAPAVNRQMYEDFRFEISKILRHLAKELPPVDED